MMRAGRLKMLPYQLWRAAEFHMVPTADGVIAGRDPDADSGKGGLLMAISPAMQPYITEKGIVPSERAV